jgi:hypothetical protein
MSFAREGSVSRHGQISGSQSFAACFYRFPWAVTAVALCIGLAAVIAMAPGRSGAPRPALSLTSSTPALPSVAVQGPGNALWYYWQSADAQWHGPLGVGAAGSTNAPPAMAVAPSGLPTVAVEGPSNSLWVYWESADAQWHGPLGVGGPGSTNASPAIAIGPNGLPTIATEGPDNSLWVFWESADAQWHGPLGVGGPGSTNASPAIAIGRNSLPTIATVGPGNSLWLFWESADAQWHGPLGVGGPGSTNASPAIVMVPQSANQTLPDVAVEGPGNSLWLFWQTIDAQWHGPYGVGGAGSSLSSPSAVIAPNGLPTIATQGPGNSLWLFWQTIDAQWHGPYGVGGAGSTTGPPKIISGAGALPTIAVGPAQAPWVYWESADAQWHGPYGLGAGSAPSPSGAPYATFSASVSEGGSGSGYSAYVNMHDASNDALSVGIQSDTTDPNSQGNPWYIWERVQNGQFTYGYLAPASPGNHLITLSWWSGSNTAEFYVDNNPIAQIPTVLVPRLFFQVEGDARQNGDSVNDVFANTQIAAGNNCPTYCGLNGSWNTGFSFDGPRATETNGQPQNGASFTVTGTASAPPGANWDNTIIAGIAMIAQYWAGQ